MPGMSGWTLAATGLTFKIGSKSLISGVTCTLPAGKVCAIIGPSGSGKSTLLRCFASSYKPSAGTVTADGERLKELGDTYRARLGYVPQDDVVHPELSVENELRFAARLRLDSDLPAERRNFLVDRVIRELGLQRQRGQKIARLSGGQRKRVNIGIELLADPRVILLDEPASGLDPATEEDLLGILRRLASQGRTVCLTTHSMEYLDQVDVVLVMMDGALIFAGGLDRLLTHFGIPHVAEMFKTLRKAEVSVWRQKWAREGTGS